MNKRLTLSLALAVVLSLIGATAAVARSDDGAVDNAKAIHGDNMHAQHGDTEGHLDPVSENVELISKLGLKNVEPGGIADVSIYGDYAYLAAWGGDTCKANGIHVVDISDVENPEQVAFIPSKEGSYPGEGVQVLSISTASFTGDILVTNNEICKGTAGFGGMNIYDVTNPSRPRPLAVGYGDFGSGKNRKKTANEIHSVYAWDAGDRAYAVMVDNEEAADVDIVDITNPKKPVLIAEYNLATAFPQILQPEQGLDEVFLHDMVVKEIDGRFVMLLSYWDAGYVQLDVTDPRNVTYISDSDFTNPDREAAESGLAVPSEGNAHQAEFTLDNAVVGADEDFSPFALVARNDDDGTDIDASQGSGTTPLQEGQTITGESVFVGRACDGDPAVPAGDGTQIAVVERGLCDFTVKVANVIEAGGYDAILIFNRTASDGCNGSLGMNVEGDIPTFGVAPREQGYAIFDIEDQYDDAACLAGDGTQQAPIPLGRTGDTLTFSSYYDGWGYVRLFDQDMTELDTYAVPEAHDPAFASGFGDLSVHEVATSQQNADLAYLSYYAAGLRVIDISGGEIEEVAAFIDEGGNNFWGVEVFVQDGVEYVALSDRDFGLYILRYTP